MVSRPVRDREIAGSNPAFPTTHLHPGTAGQHDHPRTHSTTLDIYPTRLRAPGETSTTGEKNARFKSIEELPLFWRVFGAEAALLPKHDPNRYQRRLSKVTPKDRRTQAATARDPAPAQSCA